MLILVDSCQFSYQILLITCLKLITKIAKHAWREKRSDQNVSLLECISINFCNGDLNKFLLLLRKGVYPYEYMDSWERFNETSLPPKKDFYSELILEDISDKDFLHAQKVKNIV